MDEADGVSMWGHVFRPDFFLIMTWWRAWRVRSGPRWPAPILALTATATPGQGLYQRKARHEGWPRPRDRGYL